VAVLGYQFWQRHYGVIPTIVGKNIPVAPQRAYSIVEWFGRVYLGRRRVYLPSSLTADPGRT